MLAESKGKHDQQAVYNADIENGVLNNIDIDVKS